jgi:hypothetical protein
MTIERTPRSPMPPSSATPAGELKRIPLPPLPHFRKPETTRAGSPGTPPGQDAAVPDAPPARELQGAPEVAREARRPPGAVSHLEMSELLGPDHEGGIAPAIESAIPLRTGATGATILNDLVDQIEKGLEKDLARTPLSVLSKEYRRVVACAGGPALGRTPRPTPSEPGMRRTAE